MSQLFDTAAQVCIFQLQVKEVTYNTLTHTSIKEKEITVEKLWYFL